jgi:hypothetical protein
VALQKEKEEKEKRKRRANVRRTGASLKRNGKGGSPSFPSDM